MRNRGPEYVKEHIVNSRAHAPDSIMPTFKDYNDAELDSLVAYLSSFDYTLPKTTDGKVLYDTYCLSCHGEKFDGNGPLSALLDPLPRAFKYQFIASYEKRFKDSIRDGIAGTAMPTWKNTLSDEEIDTVIEYIKKNTLGDENYVRLDVKLPKVGDPERMDPKDKGTLIEPGDPERGHEYFQKYCTSCHGKLANGKGPNAYNLVHPLPRNLINKEFLNQESVTDERLYQSILLGVAGTAMPSHDFLKDQSILDLIAFIRSNSKETK
jgi:mono/diheme cytochrome c family protein